MKLFRAGVGAQVGAGLTFAGLSFAGIATIGTLPKPSDSTARFVSFFATHHDSILTTNVLLSLANAAFLVWFALLRSRLSIAQPASPMPTLAFGGAVVFCAVGAAAATFPAGLAYYGVHGVDPGTVRLCLDLYYAANAFTATMISVAVGAVAASVLTRPVALPRWLGIISALVALVALAELAATFTLKSSGAFSPSGAYGTGVVFGSLTAWVLAVSLTIAIRRDRVAVSHTPTPASAPHQTTPAAR